MLKFWRKYVHFATVLEDNMAVEIDQSDLGWVCVDKLDESFPNFSFLENEYLYNFSMLTKELIEVIVGDDVAKFIINADQEDRTIDFGVHQ